MKIQLKMTSANCPPLGSDFHMVSILHLCSIHSHTTLCNPKGLRGEYKQVFVGGLYYHRDHSGYGQQETPSHSNASSDWLTPYPEWSLFPALILWCKLWFILSLELSNYISCHQACMLSFSGKKCKLFSTLIKTRNKKQYKINFRKLILSEPKIATDCKNKFGRSH